MFACPACKVEGLDGRFCAHCGATLRDVACARCETPLAAGVRFCHNCGTSVANAAPPPATVVLDAPPRSRIPWIIGGTATAALLLLVVAQRLNMGASLPSALPPVAPPTEATAPAVRAPDISQMSPRERAARLFDRIMRLAEEGKRDSVQLFASMAIPVYQSLDPLDAHLRYDLGRVAAAAEELDLAQAQADTILQTRPNHLLGLILAAQVAEQRGNTSAVTRFRERLLASEAAERAFGLEEYSLHDADIRAALALARSRR